MWVRLGVVDNVGDYFKSLRPKARARDSRLKYFATMLTLPDGLAA